MIEYKNNNHKFNRQFKKQEKAFKRGLRQGAAISGKELIKTLRKDMKLPKSGRLYKTAIGMTGKPLKSVRTYRASSPNEVPAVVSGDFRKSLGFEVQGSSRLVFGSGKDDIAQYAKYLETGTSRMKARKPLQRTAQKMDNQVNKNLNRNIKKQLAKIGVNIT